MLYLKYISHYDTELVKQKWKDSFLLLQIIYQASLHSC